MSRKKVLVIKRQKHRRNEGHMKPIQPELMKSTELKASLRLNTE